MTFERFVGRQRLEVAEMIETDIRWMRFDPPRKAGLWSYDLKSAPLAVVVTEHEVEVNESSGLSGEILAACATALSHPDDMQYCSN